MEAFHYQYHPLTKRLVEIVRSGELGNIRNDRRGLLRAAVEDEATSATSSPWPAAPPWTWAAIRSASCGC